MNIFDQAFEAPQELDIVLDQADTKDAIWAKAFALNRQRIREYGDRLHPAYLEGLNRLHLHAQHFPKFAELRHHLLPTGWRPVHVSGFIPCKKFGQLLANHCFPIANSLRSLDDGEHSPRPDAIDDILGHLPFLFDQQYSKYLQDLGHAMVAAATDPHEEAHFLTQYRSESLYKLGMDDDIIERANNTAAKIQEVQQRHDSLAFKLKLLFLWSVKFGLIQKNPNKAPTVFGSELISSPKDMVQALENTAKYSEFSLDAMLLSHDFGATQKSYLVVKSFDEYQQVLDECIAQHAEVATPESMQCTNANQDLSAYPHYQQSMLWLNQFIMQPHPELNRAGAICPFVAPAVQKDLAWFVTLHADSFDVAEAYAKGMTLVEIYYNLFKDKQSFRAGTLIGVFNNLPLEAHANFIDNGHRLLRSDFVRRGLMIGEFHPRSEVRSVRNESLRVMQSPIPMFAVRALSIHDLMFLDLPSNDAETRCEYLECYAYYLNDLLGKNARKRVEDRIASLREEMRQVKKWVEPERQIA